MPGCILRLLFAHTCQISEFLSEALTRTTLAYSYSHPQSISYTCYIASQRKRLRGKIKFQLCQTFLFKVQTVNHKMKKGYNSQFYMWLTALCTALRLFISSLFLLIECFQLMSILIEGVHCSAIWAVKKYGEIAQFR